MYHHEWIQRFFKCILDATKELISDGINMLLAVVEATDIKGIVLFPLLLFFFLEAFQVLICSP